MQAFPLSHLLRLAFSDPPRWLNGSPHPDLPVEWATAALDELSPGDLLLLSTGASQPDLSASLGVAQARKACAVLLFGEQPLSDGLPPAQELPVGWLPSPQDTRPAWRTVLMLWLNQRAALIDRGVRIHTQLAQQAAEGGGLDELAISIARLSNRGVVVQNKRLEILAHTSSSTLAGIWEDALAVLCAADMLPEPLRDRKQAGRQPAVLTQELPGGLSRLITPVVAGEVARGYLSLVGVAGELDALDRVILEQGALACAVEMFRVKAVRETEKRLKGDLLDALLQENLSPRDARLWVQDMGLNLDHPYAALRFCWDGLNPPSRRRLETLVNGEASRLGMQGVVHAMGVEVISFCQAPGDAPRPEVLLNMARAVHLQAEREFPDVFLRCGVGAPAPDLDTWRLSFRQAGQALEMARRFKERRPLYYPDLSVYRLLLQMESSPELASFLEETLGRLLAHEGSTELLHTLEVYFEHNGNLAQTAEALFIHRNTLLPSGAHCCHHRPQPRPRRNPPRRPARPAYPPPFLSCVIYTKNPPHLLVKIPIDNHAAPR